MALSPEAFLRDFLLPQINGGELKVGRPLDLDDLDQLRSYCATPSEITVRIEAQLQRAAALTWLYPVQTPVDEGLLRLAVGLHNLLFLSHPGCESWRIRRAALERLVAFTAECIAVGPPANEDELVARHALLEGLPRLTRADVVLSFWAGQRSFLGRSPPRRLLAWRGLRRVRQQREVVQWLATVDDLEQDRLVDLLFLQSPLTMLLSIDRPAPRFSLATLFPYLGHPGICRLVVHRYLEMGLERVGPVIARDFWQLVSDPGAPFRALSRRRLSWLELGLQRWGGILYAEAGRSVAGWRAGKRLHGEQLRQALVASGLPLLLITALVHYLYATECIGRTPDPPRVDPGDPRASLCSVLVAAAECDLLVGAATVGDRQVAERLEALVADGRRALGEAADWFCTALDGALSGRRR
jgi:hypothetical protein